MQYIDVVINNKSNNTDNFYTYLAPDEVKTGARLNVPFARRKKPVEAYCMRTGVSPSCDASRIREIDSCIPERSLDQEMIDTAVWMRKRYGVRYIDAVKMFTSPGKRISGRKKASGPDGESMDEADRMERIMSGVRQAESLVDLTQEQKNAEEMIGKAADSGEFKAFLIKGVTNSGKTEVYMRTAARVLASGRSVIVLLPEIALSAQVVKRFAERFGEDVIATLHSRLTTSERLREWMRIKEGRARIVIGPRTSVFAPLEDIGAIIIDEEHEGTYKSDHNPKYETVDIAYMRASKHKAVLVLGSATPSVVSYYRAKSGIYQLIEMKYRIGDSIMPHIDVVDMRKEASAGNTGVISRDLAAGISEALSRREQIILFLNRRGFSTHILCPDCGFRMTCPDCGITLTYHKAWNAAVCHYCGRRFEPPSVCPDCGSRTISYVGAGTEKVEETVRELWPSATAARFDLDTAAQPDATEKVIGDFQSGDTDILIGTQILAKGLDFRNVGLVGIINADVSLNIPDYRSSERTYQLITQVAGRAGRDGGSSRVLIQTYEPDSDIIREAASGDYELFCENELLHRNIMNYPPYSDIIAFGFVSSSPDKAMELAEAFRKRLASIPYAPKDAVLLRPRLDERKTDGKFRASFLVKAPQGSRSGYVGEFMKARELFIAEKKDCFIDIDINPY